MVLILMLMMLVVIAGERVLQRIKGTDQAICPSRDVEEKRGLGTNIKRCQKLHSMSAYTCMHNILHIYAQYMHVCLTML